ncbi:class I SAM-dependent methyltransferase [Microbacterium indicum]|uniref:class I SAM-dependent methyltransferase n=1 Tax=Microbacterium indicum TaxID=358100 RepID=UPI00068865B4|nr:class I SAM-dependent methyltransferase [Microbacterium indicum]
MAEPSSGEELLRDAIAERNTAQNEAASLREALDSLRGEHDRLLRYANNQLRAVQRTLKFMPRELLTDTQAMYQLMQRYRPMATLPNIAGWALSPTGLLALTDIVVKSQATTVVECGSGTSTLWLAYAMRSLGRGKVTAIDHLPEYVERTRAIIREHDLEDYAEVVHAPIVERSTPRGDYPWYGFTLDEIDGAIDVLLVDGPPQSTGSHARYPAIPAFAPRLARGAWLVADDVDRADEQEMIEWWLEEEPRLSRDSTPGPGLEILRFDA